jgi:hypothetical protein
VAEPSTFDVEGTASDVIRPEAPGMDISACSDAVRDAIVSRADTPAEGALFAVFVDTDGRVLTTVEVGEGTRHVDELFFRHLVTLVDDLRLDAVVFVVCRSAGRPRRVDRLLWRELDRRLACAHTRLVDLMVTGTDRLWSASTGRYRGFDRPGTTSVHRTPEPLTDEPAAAPTPSAAC